MARLTVSSTNRIRINNIISSTYIDMYYKWKKKHPLSKEYTIKQMNDNIRNVKSVIGTEVNVQPSRFQPWTNKGWCEAYCKHWYFAVVLGWNRKGESIAIIQDCHYEAEHHNDDMNPYEARAAFKTPLEECQEWMMKLGCYNQFQIENLKEKGILS